VREPCVREPLLLAMLLSGRLVGFDEPLSVRQRALKVTALELLAVIWILPQLCWKLLAPLPCVRLPFWLLIPWSVKLAGFAVPSAVRQTAVNVGELPE